VRETKRGLGLAAAIGPDVSRRAAEAAEKAGYDSFWLNSPPGADALELLHAAARATRSIWLGVGVIPLSHESPDAIAQRVTEHQLPLDRFYLGIGSGSAPGGLERVASGVRALNAALSCELIVAAMGPAMCRLAGEEADGVLLNWLTPQFAQQSAAWVREAAEQRGRATPRIMAYVRVTQGAEGYSRLEHEAERYAGIPHYARHFNRMGVAAIETAITGDTSDEIQAGLATWNGIVDEIVVRVISGQDTFEWVHAVLEAAQPAK
jgi:alkanesulfonate monooxygenase SsuD/methylene tetrahydromethanopterin reductase-like flavin-dependent oxidoreductase (luciferase family)